jgi:hypothetical protein
MQTRRRLPALSASAGEQVRRRSAFSLPMPAARVRRSCRGKAAGRFPRTRVPGRRQHLPPSWPAPAGRGSPTPSGGRDTRRIGPQLPFEKKHDFSTHDVANWAIAEKAVK